MSSRSGPSEGEWQKALLGVAYRLYVCVHTRGLMVASEVLSRGWSAPSASEGSEGHSRYDL